MYNTKDVLTFMTDFYLTPIIADNSQKFRFYDFYK